VPKKKKKIGKDQQKSMVTSTEKLPKWRPQSICHDPLCKTT